MQTRLVFLSLALGLGACGGPAIQHRVEPQAVADLPKELEQEIAHKREVIQDEKNAEKRAEAAARKAAFALQDARTKSQVLAAQLEGARAQLELVNELFSGPDHAQERDAKASPLQKRIAGLQARLDAKEAEIAWREAALEQHRAGAALAEMKRLLAEAEYELEQAEAAYESGSPLTDQIRLSDFKLQAAELMDQVSQASQDMALLDDAMQSAKSQYKVAKSNVPAHALDADKLKTLRKENKRLTARIKKLKRELASAQAPASRVASEPDRKSVV